MKWYAGLMIFKTDKLMKTDKPKVQKKLTKKAVKKELEGSLTQKFSEAVTHLGHDAEKIGNELAKAAKDVAAKLARKLKSSDKNADGKPAKDEKLQLKGSKKAKKEVNKAVSKPAPVVSSIKVPQIDLAENAEKAVTRAEKSSTLIEDDQQGKAASPKRKRNSAGSITSEKSEETKTDAALVDNQQGKAAGRPAKSAATRKSSTAAKPAPRTHKAKVVRTDGPKRGSTTPVTEKPMEGPPVPQKGPGKRDSDETPEAKATDEAADKDQVPDHTK